MEKVKIGGQYRCLAIGLEKEVLGVVEKAYTNTFLINVIDYNDVDEHRLIEYHYRVLVPYDSIVDSLNSVEECEVIHNS